VGACSHACTEISFCWAGVATGQGAAGWVFVHMLDKEAKKLAGRDWLQDEVDYGWGSSGRRPALAAARSSQHPATRPTHLVPRKLVSVHRRVRQQVVAVKQPPARCACNILVAAPRLRITALPCMERLLLLWLALVGLVLLLRLLLLLRSVSLWLLLWQLHWELHLLRSRTAAALGVRLACQPAACVHGGVVHSGLLQHGPQKSEKRVDVVRGMQAWCRAARGMRHPPLGFDAPGGNWMASEGWWATTACMYVCVCVSVCVCMCVCACAHCLEEAVLLHP